MKKLLSIAVLGLLATGCSEQVIKRQVEVDPTQQQPGETTPPEGTTPPEETKPAVQTVSPDACLDGQDLDGADVDIKTCPAIPEIPADVGTGAKKFSLGAWELGETSKGDTYVYGTLAEPAAAGGKRVLEFDGGSVEVDDKNVECWAKGYYRLRKILQNPPAEYVKLKNGGFQYRFFQFQTDMRNGSTGYKKISSFEDHLVKWVTIITADGTCQQPTVKQFTDYAKSELTRRGL